MLKVNYKKNLPIVEYAVIILLMFISALNKIKLIQGNNILNNKKSSIECLEHVSNKEKVNKTAGKYGYYNAFKVLDNYKEINIKSVNNNTQNQEANLQVEYCGDINGYIRTIEEIKKYDNFKSVNNVRLEVSDSIVKIFFDISFIKNI